MMNLHGLATDNNGNVYLTGGGNDPNITFFSANSGTTITLNNASPYLVKYDQLGNVAWAESVTGSPDWQGIAIAGEYLYRTGSFSGTVTIGTTTLTSVGENDVFTAEYDLNGNVIWAKSAGGSGIEMGIGIAIDGSRSVYITGMFFSPSMKFGTITLTNRGSSSTADIYFAKYDANGNLQWATSAGGISYDNSWSIATEADGNTYITGDSQSASLTFYSATSSGTTITLNGTSSGPVGYYIVMYDPNGNVTWAKNSGSSGSGQGVATDQNGYVYATGQCYNNYNFGLTKDKPAPGPVAELFLVKYNSLGSGQWVQWAVGTSFPQDAAIDINGNVLITGYFSSSTLVFGTITLTIGNSGGRRYVHCQIRCIRQCTLGKKRRSPSYRFNV